MSDYDDIFRTSVDDPEAFWLDAAETIDWSRRTHPGARLVEPAVLPLVPRRRAQHLPQRARPARRRRPRRPGRADLRQPGHRRPAARYTLLPSCATRSRRSPACCAGLGVGKGDRVVIYMPMVPEAVDRDAGLRADRRRPLGGVRRVRRRGSWPSGSTTPRPTVIVVGVLRHRGQAGHRVQAAAGQGDRARRAQAGPSASSCSARRPPRAIGRARRRLGGGDGDGAPPADCVAGRGHRPALHPLHLGHHRQAEGRRARQRRPRGRAGAGRCRTSTTSARATSCSPPPTSGGSSATPTSSTRRCSSARRPCSTRASRSARPTPAQFWRVVAEHGVKALFTAPTAFRAIKKEDPDAANCSPGYDLSSLQYLFLAGERLDPETYHWATELLGVPVVDHWWQTETGWPIVANPAGIEPLRAQARLAVGAGARLGRAGPRRRRRRRSRAGDGRRDRRSSCRCRPGALPTLWDDDERFVASYLSALRRLLPHRRRRPPRRGRLPVRDGPHRRRHQRRRAPALHRLDGGGARRRTPTSPSAP